jgi:ATP-dependent Lon protease
VIIPDSNMKDVLLEKRYEGKIEIIPAKTLIDVVKYALVKGETLSAKMEAIADD